MEDNKEIHETVEGDGAVAEPAGIKAGEAKEGITKVNLAMLAGSVAYVLVQFGFIILLQLIFGEKRWSELDSNTKTILRLAPNYLISLPLVMFLLSRLPGTELKRSGLTIKRFLAALAVCFGIMIGCNFLGLVVSGLLGSLLNVEVNNVVEDLISDITPSFAVIIVSLVGPIYEELIFRKFLVTRLVRYGEGVAVVLSALMFGLFHGNWNQFVYAFGLGMFLAYIFIKTGDIKITMAIHMIINFSGSVILAGLMSWADYGQLAMVSQSAATGDLSAMNAYLEEHLVAVLCLYGWLLLEYGMAFTGIVMLIIFHKKLRLDPRELALPRKEKAAIMFGNIGMIFFGLFWIVVIVAQFFGIG